MNEKYCMVWSPRKQLYRIFALKSFGDVEKWDMGGFIESERNLSLFGDAWIDNNSMVINNAFVCHNAIVRDNAFVCDNVLVCHNAIVECNSFVLDNAIICNNAKLGGNSITSNNTIVRGDAIIFTEQEYKDYLSYQHKEQRDEEALPDVSSTQTT